MFERCECVFLLFDELPSTFGLIIELGGRGVYEMLQISVLVALITLFSWKTQD